MANSLSAVSLATPAEDFVQCEFSTVQNTRYRVEKSADGVWHHELRDAATGENIYDHRVPMHYVVGSGARGRSYLSDVNGRLFQSPITWYTEAAKWDLSPGFVPGAHARFDRRVNHACLNCHAGLSKTHETDPDRFASPPFLEHAIGCERCHGPGSVHAEYHRQAPSLRSEQDPIVNPADLKPHLQDAICNQCHLQGQRRVLNAGKTEFDFRPGMHLNEVWTTILKTQGVESGVADAVSQVEQMHASTCFQQSNGKMTCTSCHDPHAYPTASDKEQFYKSACQACHSSDSSDCREQLPMRAAQKDSCVACHMPHFGAADVHSSQTDHRILRRPAPTKSKPELPVRRPEELRFFDEPDLPAQEVATQRAAGIFMAESGYLHQNAEASRNAVRILTPNQISKSTDSEGLLALGKAYLQLNRRRDGFEALQRVVELSPNAEEAIELMAISSHEANQLQSARQYYKRLIELNPDRARYHGRYSHVLGQLGNIEDSITAGEKALELDPSLSQTHAWLVQMYEILGETAKAKRHKDLLKLFQLPMEQKN